MIFKEKWFIYSVCALFFVIIIDLIKKNILDKNIIKPNELIIYTAIIMGIIGIFNLYFDTKCINPIKLNIKIILILFLLSILSYFFNIAFINSINLAPEAALTGMIVSLNIIFIYIFSSLFFKKSPKFNWKVLLGFLVTCIGINIITFFI